MKSEKTLELITTLTNSVIPLLEDYIKEYASEVTDERGVSMDDMRTMNIQMMLCVTAAMHSTLKGQAAMVEGSSGDKDLAKAFSATVLGLTMDEIQSSLIPKMFGADMVVAVVRVMLDSKIANMGNSLPTDLKKKNDELRAKIMNPSAGSSFSDVLKDIKKKAH
jgi:hypothetical protein